MAPIPPLQPSLVAPSVVRGGLSVLVFSAAALSTVSALLFPPTSANEATDRNHAIGGGVSTSASIFIRDAASVLWRSTQIAASPRRTHNVPAHPLPFAPFSIKGFIGRGSPALCESTSSVARENGASSALSVPSEVDVNVDSDSADSPPPFDTRGRKYELLRHPCRSLVESHAIFGPLLGPGKIERYDVYRRRSEDEHQDHSVDIGSSAIRGGGGDYETERGFGSGAGEVAVADLRMGRRLDGHDGIVHGGIICLLFDDAMGWGYDALVLTEREKKRKRKDELVVSEKIPEADGTDTAGGYEIEEDIPTIVTANLSVDFRAPLPANTEAIMRINHDRTEGRKLYFSAHLESVDGRTLYSEATSLFVIPRKK